MCLWYYSFFLDNPFAFWCLNFLSVTFLYHFISMFIKWFLKRKNLETFWFKPVIFKENSYLKVMLAHSKRSGPAADGLSRALNWLTPPPPPQSSYRWEDSTLLLWGGSATEPWWDQVLLPHCLREQFHLWKIVSWYSVNFISVFVKKVVLSYFISHIASTLWKVQELTGTILSNIIAFWMFALTEVNKYFMLLKEKFENTDKRKNKLQPHLCITLQC